MLPTFAPKSLPSGIFWAIVSVCLSYLIFQLIYIPYAALSVDEFWFAHHIYEYTHKLPYRDFLPYKTVLGYYLLSLPMFIWHTLLQPLYYIKDEIAMINTLFLAGISLWLTRFFNPKAVIYSVLFILTNHLFLIYSVDLRVDMLTSWLGLLSILLILANRPALAGTLLAISFMISQKAIWFWVATNFAFGCYWLFILRNSQVIRHTIIFNAVMMLSIAIYIGFWSAQSNLNTVLHSVFYEGYTQSKITWYSQIYYTCWQVILSNGPLLVMLWPLTWLTLWIRPPQDKIEYPRRFFIAIYAATMMLFIISYQQPFPYGMVYTIPIYFLIYPDFFAWLAVLFKQKPILKPIHSRILFWFISLYTISIISIMIFMALPFAYYLMALIPVCLGIFMLTPSNKTAADSLKIYLIITLIFTGMVYPMLRFGYTAYLIKNHYQKFMMIVANELLKEGGGFFAGTPFLYHQDQAIRGLKNLINPAIEYLNHPAKKLLPIMISSLYLEPRSTQEVIHDLTITPVKFYVNNYRIYSLPSSIHRYLEAEFDHYWGSIYIYAPKISAKKQNFLLKFSGKYQVLAAQNAKIFIDNKKIMPNTVISLNQGAHSSSADYFYRLKYIPNHPIKLEKQYINDNWYYLVKAIVT